MNSITLANKPLIDGDEVHRVLRLLLPSGRVTELRALDVVTSNDRWPHTATGYFDDAEKLVKALRNIQKATGIYIIPNPVQPGLLARAANRIKKAAKGESTSDADITARHWLLIDCDPQRPSGISATDAEHTSALERTETVRHSLHYNYGWPAPIVADSGNGGHLLYRIDLPRDDAGLVEKCLISLAAQFDDDFVKIDRTVFNPARIWKLYGTLACKGDSTPDRPHRMSRILLAPDPIQVVDRKLVEGLASEAISGSPDKHNHATISKPFDIESFMSRHGFEADGPEPWQGGRRWVFRRSPMCSHHDGAAFLVQHASGALAAKCHHNSCNWGWVDLRQRYELPRSTNNGQAYNRKRTGTNGKKPPRALEFIEPYRTFPIDVLPVAVREFVAEAAAAIGCDPSFVALPLLGCLATAIGNKRVIRLKRTWTEPAIVWAAIIGKSGTHKTPAIQAAMRFLYRKQEESIDAFKEKIMQYEEQKAIYDRDYAAWKRTRKDIAEPPPWPPQVPVCQRYVTTDTTIEALAALLAMQFDGLLVSRDELAGWLGGIAEYKGGKGSDLGHWLASWSGAPLTVDRKTGAVPMLHIPRASVSIIGGIQPGVLRKAIGQEHLQDGLCARLLLAMPDPKPVRWTETIIDPPVEAAFASMFERLLSLEPAADEDGNPAPYAMPPTEHAKNIWKDFYNRHRQEIAGLDDDLAAAWSKLEAYAARFALIFQLCSWAAGESDTNAEAIDETAMLSGIALADWFGNEARRVYGVFAESDCDRQYRELYELIQRRGGTITARELAHASRRYRGRGVAEATLEELAHAEVGTWNVASTATNKRREFTLAPVVTVTDSLETPQTRESVTVTTDGMSGGRS